MLLDAKDGRRKIHTIEDRVEEGASIIPILLPGIMPGLAKGTLTPTFRSSIPPPRIISRTRLIDSIRARLREKFLQNIEVNKMNK